jgi:hypothetical protein
VATPAEMPGLFFANGLKLQTALIAAIEAKGLFRAITNGAATFAIIAIDVIKSARFVGAGCHHHPDLIPPVTRGPLADRGAVQ